MRVDRRRALSAAPPRRIRTPAGDGGLAYSVLGPAHHFTPAEAAAPLRQARDTGAGIAAFEATHRSLRGLLGMALVPLVVLAITPLIRPRRWWRFALTYLIPVIPLAVWWDATVSSLRT